MAASKGCITIRNQKHLHLDEFSDSLPPKANKTRLANEENVPFFGHPRTSVVDPMVSTTCKPRCILAVVDSQSLQEVTFPLAIPYDGAETSTAQRLASF